MVREGDRVVGVPPPLSTCVRSPRVRASSWNVSSRILRSSVGPSTVAMCISPTAHFLRPAGVVVLRRRARAAAPDPRSPTCAGARNRGSRFRRWWHRGGARAAGADDDQRSLDRVGRGLGGVTGVPVLHPEAAHQPVHHDRLDAFDDVGVVAEVDGDRADECSNPSCQPSAPKSVRPVCGRRALEELVGSGDHGCLHDTPIVRPRASDVAHADAGPARARRRRDLTARGETDGTGAD